MIFITQLITIVEGQEQIFDEFENTATALLFKHNGCLLFRVRPTTNNFIGNSILKPYEIHFITFPKQEDLDNFMQDKERNKHLYLKEQSVKISFLVKGSLF